MKGRSRGLNRRVGKTNEALYETGPGRVRSAEEGKPACGRSEGRLVGLGDGLAAGPLERAGDIIPACWQRGARELVEHPPDQGERGGIRSGSCGEGDGHVQVVDCRLHGQGGGEVGRGQGVALCGQRLIGAGPGSFR